VKKLLVCLLVVLISSPCLASSWSKAFNAGEESVKGLSGWSVRVDKLGSWIETYSVKIKWDKFLPNFGTWDVNGEPKNLLSVSPTKIVITRSWGLDLGQTSMAINASRRLADMTVVARMKEDFYAIAGHIQHAEGLEVPFAIVWDYEARKARLFMGDEEWEKVLQQ